MRVQEHSTPGSRIEAVSFDVTGTLIHCPRAGDVYSQVLSRHGIAGSPKDFHRIIPRVWRELSCRVDPRRDRFSLHPKGERGWWHRFVERVCELLESPPPTRFASAELYHRFARPDAWEVFPDVTPALEDLKRAGLRLGVVSNWDHRLPRLLEGLGLSQFFDVIEHSAACGVEKPHPLIFERCQQALGAAPGHMVHIGDQRFEDVEGAKGAGLHALRIDRREHRAGLSQLSAMILDGRLDANRPEGDLP